MLERDYDVIVIGSGTAGMSAAVEARDAGARVLVCEAGDRLGGSSAASGGLFMAAGTDMQRAQGVEDSADALFEHYMAVNKFEVEPAIVRRFVDEGPDCINWLKSLGVEFNDEVLAVGQTAIPRGHVPKMYGFGHTQALEAAITRGGVDVALNTRVERILTDANGRVRGIAAEGIEVSSHAVVVACGGLGCADKTLKEEYFPDSCRHGDDWHFYIGVKTNRGDVINLGKDIGAEIFGRNCGLLMNVGRNQSFIEGPQPGWPVWVNRNGRRFINEESDYSIIYLLVGKQPEGVFFGIMDQDGFDHEKRDPRYHFPNIFDDAGGQSWEPEQLAESLARGAMQKAGTLKDLAIKIGVDPDTLAATIEEYNADCLAGRDSHYLKSPRWMIPVVKPPFYAIERRAAQISLTQVGLRINADARVYKEKGGYIPGLYAAGEAAGGIFTQYVGSGISIGNCVVFGRTAGRNAAKDRLANGV